MKPDAVAIVIGVLALVGAALFVQWLGEQPPDWSVVTSSSSKSGVALPRVVQAD